MPLYLNHHGSISKTTGSSSNNNNNHVSSLSWSSVIYYWKYLSTTFMLFAFLIVTVVIPYQQRQLFSYSEYVLQEGQQHQQEQHLYRDSTMTTNNRFSYTNTGSSSDIGVGDARTDSWAEVVDNDSTTRTNSNGKVEGEIRLLRSIRMHQSDQATILESPGTATTIQTGEDKGESGHVILSEEENLNGIIARPFRSWPVINGTLPFPCYPPTQDWKTMKVQYTPSNRGFIYVKPYKTGSSTTSGVHLRIARNVAQRNEGLNMTICDSRFDHGPDFYPGHTLYRNRIYDESFVWSIIRHPTKRAVSQFFHFEVSREKIEPTDENFIKFIRKYRFKMMQDYYYRALYTEARFNRRSVEPVSAANQILSSYNFIGITERLDESFVVLMMLLNLSIADILYLSAKTNGGYDDAGGRDQVICTYIWPSFVTPGVDEYFNSTEWQDTIHNDMLLYKAINRSLDMTIVSLGRGTFNENLQKFRHALQVARDKCTPKVVFPCDLGGKYHPTTDCIWRDSGCGATCLDDVATELNLW